MLVAWTLRVLNSFFNLWLVVVSSSLHQHSVRGGTTKIRLQSPNTFNFCNPDDWPRWKSHYQLLREASKLSEAGDGKHISIFLGDASTCINKYYSRRSPKLCQHLHKIWRIRRNIGYECTQFNEQIKPAEQRNGGGVNHAPAQPG